MSENGGEMGKLASALAKAQAAFLPVEKTRTVKVKMRAEAGGGTYSFSYAPLDTVLAATRPALAANGLALTQLIVHEELVTLLMHEAGGSLEARSALPKLAKMQDLGGAITYLRRYAIQAILGVAAEEDDDGNAAAGNAREITDEERHEAEFLAAKAAKSAAPSPAKTVPERAAAAGKPVAAAATAARKEAELPGHVKRFFAVASEHGISEEDQKKILAEFEIVSRKGIPAAKLPAIIRRMEEWVGVAAPEPTPDEAPAEEAKPAPAKPAVKDALVSVFDVSKLRLLMDATGATPHAAVASVCVGRKVTDLRELAKSECAHVVDILTKAKAGDPGAVKFLKDAKDATTPF